MRVELVPDLVLDFDGFLLYFLGFSLDLFLYFDGFLFNFLGFALEFFFDLAPNFDSFFLSLDSFAFGLTRPVRHGLFHLVLDLASPVADAPKQ